MVVVLAWGAVFYLLMISVSVWMLMSEFFVNGRLMKEIRFYAFRVCLSTSLNWTRIKSFFMFSK